jgi:hypothetical protein
MKLAIMQPYFLPYIGYFQLINAVDEFVVYDNIEFSKKGWINRNRILVNGKDSYISVPLKKDSDYLDVKDRYLAEIWSSERNKMLNKINSSYRKSPNFNSIYPLIEECIMFEERNLFKFILNSFNLVKKYLGIHTPLLTSSTISIDHELRAEKKVIEICKAMSADHYINPITGKVLYRKEVFGEKEIALSFLECKASAYPQFGNTFVPRLSIIDVMMFNSKERINEMLKEYEIT